MTFASFVVAMGLTNDLEKGIVDRFRSLPISRASILVGRSISSLIHSSIGIVVMALTGLAIGWGMHNGVADAALAYLLLLLFGFSMIWVGIWVGSMLRSVEAVQGFMFTIMFPLTFVANTFAPTENMPDLAARRSPSGIPSPRSRRACRELWGNDGDLTRSPGHRLAAAAPGDRNGDLVDHLHRDLRAAGAGGLQAARQRLADASSGRHRRDLCPGRLALVGAAP